MPRARSNTLAGEENCERLYVIRNYTSFDKARAARRGKTSKATARTLDEEEIALQEFILAAGDTAVPIEARCIRGNTGFAASNFVQAVDANLLVVPWEVEFGTGTETAGPHRLGERRHSLQFVDRALTGAPFRLSCRKIVIPSRRTTASDLRV